LNNGTIQLQKAKSKMIQKKINSLLQSRHFWRTVDFDELSEIYTSILLRSLATSVVGLFIPVYLHGLGYSVRTIFAFFIVFFIARIVIDPLSALIVGRIGPKHTIALSTISNIIVLLMLLTMKDMGWPLYFIAVAYSLTNSMFFIAFHTDFSKIKHTKHGGKELGYVTILEKLGGVAGPLIGGVIATIYSPSYTIVLSIVLFLASLIPLFLTNEPVKVHQKLTLKGFKIRSHSREIVSYACLNAENVISILLWNFYLSLAIFVTSPYVKIGTVVAISTALSLLSVQFVGRRVDAKKGRLLLKRGVIANSLIHIGRLFVASPVGVLITNILNDPVTVMFRMPFVKQFYDFSDQVPGYRIVYIAANEMFGNILKACVWVVLYIASAYVADITAIKGAFVFAAILSMGIALQPTKVNNQP
jgi:MFS family permease